MNDGIIKVFKENKYPEAVKFYAELFKKGRPKYEFRCLQN